MWRPLSQSFADVCVTQVRPRRSQTREWETRWRRLEVCLSTKTTSWARAWCPFVEPMAFVDHDSLSFRAHRTSEWTSTQVKMSTQDERTRKGRTHIHECPYGFMRRRGAWARPKLSLVTRCLNEQQEGDKTTQGKRHHIIHPKIFFYERLKATAYLFKLNYTKTIIGQEIGR